VIAPWALFLIAAVAAVTFGMLWQQGETEDARRAEVTQVAREFVTTLTNFSAATIEADADAIKSFAVGDFAEEADTFFGEEAVAAIADAEASSSGDIEALFIQSLEGDEASVFGVVNETVTNSGLGQPQTDTLRLEVGLIETSDGWKVNRVDVFQAPGTGVVGPPVS
jgi:hypothetical protein